LAGNKIKFLLAKPKITVLTTILIILLINLVFSQVVERFPKPDFKSGYVYPQTSDPKPRSQALEYLDVFVLLLALSLASYFALKMRSRQAIFLLMIFSLVYFGFWREGCICPIGSIQNVTYALFDSSYAIPVTVIAFFVLPLIFTLFFGRTFCAAVCPLGAIQDVVVLKPVSLPAWLNAALSLLPYIYLGLALLFAATGAGFIICQYDPFVGFFRFGATFNLILFGLFLLLLGTVVARPYCRFLCPYGVLLNWMSRLSRRHVTITPAECTNCRLCEASCPFGAINKADEMIVPENKKSATRRLGLLLLLVPVIILAGGWTVSRLYVPLSGLHNTVSLAEEIRLENSGQRTETTIETRTFRASGKPVEQLFLEAQAIQGKFKTGGWLLGGFLGLIFCIKLINLAVRKKQTEYTTDTGTCFSCARCFASCPIEQERRVPLNRISILDDF
jgi:NosR/NirI family nitrous oxide reductase transcriptional regulator